MDESSCITTMIDDLKELLYCNKFILKNKDTKSSSKKIKKLIEKLESEEYEDVIDKDKLEEIINDI